MYPDERVAAFIGQNFLPVKIHVKENPQGFERFKAQWTPTVIIADSGGAEQHRFEGYLPADEFLSQLQLGLGKSAFAHGKFDDAERWFREVEQRSNSSDAAPEALYWEGVSRYKASGDPKALAETAAAFQNRYRESAWAKKASVWAA